MSVTEGSGTPAVRPESAREGGPYDVRLEEDRWATVRHLVEAVAIVCAGIWAFYTFVYQEKIKPAGEPAAINLSITLTSLGHSRERDIIEVAVILRNTGKTEIDMAADAYNIWGERYGPRPVRRTSESPQRLEDRHDLPVVSRRLVAAFAELRDMAIGGRRGVHLIIEPNASEQITYVIAVPPGAYDVLHAQGIAIPIKTEVTKRVSVAVKHTRVGGYWIFSHDPTVFEDDNESDFAPPR